MQCNVVVADGRVITPAGVLQLFLRFRKFLLQQQKLRILRCIFFVFRFGKKEPDGVSQFVFGVLPLFYVRVDFRAPACPAAQFFRPLRFAGRRVGKRRKQPVAAFKPVQRFFPRFVGQGVEFCQLVVKKDAAYQKHNKNRGPDHLSSPCKTGWRFYNNHVWRKYNFFIGVIGRFICG